MEIHFFADQQKFRQWLAKNHANNSELFLGFYKVHTGRPSVSWSQSVDQALCFGWIDGLRKSIDQDSYFIRFTPRKSNSIWSAVNIKKVEALQKAGLMTDAGEKAYSFRTANKSKIYAHEKEVAKLDLSLDRIFKKNKKAWTFFNLQAPSYQRLMLHWITSAKRDETRVGRLKKTMEISAAQQRMKIY